MSEAIAAEMPKVEVKGGVVPYLSVEGAVKAAEFYGKAFGAEVAAMYGPDEGGKTMHAHLYINGSSVMLSDFYPDHGHVYEKPQAFNLNIQVDDIQAWWTRAIEAGCTEIMPPQKMFWGDTYGQLVDPFGVVWSMNQAAA